VCSLQPDLGGEQVQGQSYRRHSGAVWALQPLYSDRRDDLRNRPPGDLQQQNKNYKTVTEDKLIAFTLPFNIWDDKKLFSSLITIFIAAFYVNIL